MDSPSLDTDLFLSWPEPLRSFTYDIGMPISTLLELYALATFSPYLSVSSLIFS